MALLSGQIVRVLDKNQKIDSHDFLLKIEDKLNHLTVGMLKASVFDVLKESLSTKERYIVLGHFHKYNDDNSKIVVGTRSYKKSSACSGLKEPSLEGVVNCMHLVNCSLRNISKSD